MRKYRRKHIGNFAVNYIFNLYNGRWEIRVPVGNKTALVFWHKVINEFTNGRYIFHSESTPDWEGFVYTFYTH
jgi:predicted acetyltransferase